MSGLPGSAWQPAQFRAAQSGSAWLPASLLPLCPASLAQPGQPAQLRAAQSGSAQLPASAWEIVCLAARLPEPYSPSSGPLQQSKGTSIHLYTIYYILYILYYILYTMYYLLFIIYYILYLIYLIVCESEGAALGFLCCWQAVE